MRIALLVLVVAACGPNRGRQLKQCEVLVDTAADDLAECLVKQYDWDADSAQQAELHYVAEVARQQRSKKP